MKAGGIHPQSWSSAEWRRAETNTSSADLADDGLVSGTFDEQRSFGGRGAGHPGPCGPERDPRPARGLGPHRRPRPGDHPADPEPCRGHLLRAGLGDMGFDAGAFDGDLRVRGVMSRKAFSLVSVMEQEGVLNQWGHRVEEGDIVAIPPGGELDGRFQGHVAYAVVTAPWGLVMQRAEGVRMAGRPLLLDRAGGLFAAARGRAACKRVLQGCSSLLRAMGGGVPSEAVAFLRDELLDGLLTALAEVKVEGARRQGALNAARIVRGAEDFLEGGGARQAVQIEDICQALNISRRTLYRAFHDLLDVSPKAYLRLKNMSAARARLLDAGNRPITVTQVALDQGFWELGRFSRAYRAMFGEPVRDPARRPGRGPRRGP